MRITLNVLTGHIDLDDQQFQVKCALPIYSVSEPLIRSWIIEIDKRIRVSSDAQNTESVDVTKHYNAT